MENKRHYKDVLLKKIDLVTFFGFTKPTLYTWQCDNGFEEKQKNLFGIDYINFVRQKRIEKSNEFVVKNKIQVFSNIKGGVGKSTLSSQYCMLASMMGLKVLAIDLDAQSHLTNQLLDNPNNEEFLTIYDALINNVPTSKCIKKLSETLDIIPSSLKNVKIDTHLITQVKREVRFLKKINEISDNYDLISIDTNPTDSELNKNAYVASDLINIVCSTDFLAFNGLKLMLDSVEVINENFNTNKNITIIPNMYDSRDGSSLRALGAMSSYYSDILAKTIVRKNTTFRDATEQRNSIYLINKRSSGAKDIVDLTKELLSK